MTHRLLALAAAILAGTTPALAQAPKPAQPAPAAQAKAPEAVITLEKGGEIRIELFRTDAPGRSEEHTSELQSLAYLVCRLLLEKKKKIDHGWHPSALAISAH